MKYPRKQLPTQFFIVCITWKSFIDYIPPLSGTIWSSDNSPNILWIRNQLVHIQVLEVCISITLHRQILFMFSLFLGCSFHLHQNTDRPIPPLALLNHILQRCLGFSNSVGLAKWLPVVPKKQKIRGFNTLYLKKTQNQTQTQKTTTPPPPPNQTNKKKNPPQNLRSFNFPLEIGKQQ